LVAAAKFLVAATKNLFVVLNFVAVTKQFFSVFFRIVFYIKKKAIRRKISRQTLPFDYLMIGIYKGLIKAPLIYNYQELENMQMAYLLFPGLIFTFILFTTCEFMH